MQQKFRELNKDNSGTISCKEIKLAYNQFHLSDKGAEFLVNAVSDKPAIDIQTFPIFDAWINKIWSGFTQTAFGKTKITE